MWFTIAFCWKTIRMRTEFCWKPCTILWDIKIIVEITPTVSHYNLPQYPSYSVISTIISCPLRIVQDCQESTASNLHSPHWSSKEYYLVMSSCEHSTRRDFYLRHSESDVRLILTTRLKFRSCVTVSNQIMPQISLLHGKTTPTMDYETQQFLLRYVST